MAGNFSGGPGVENPPYNTDDTSSISGRGTKTVEQVSPMCWVHGLQATQRDCLQAAVKELAGYN